MSRKTKLYVLTAICLFSISGVFRSRTPLSGGMTEMDVDEPVVTPGVKAREDRIFFLETSGKGNINFRQSCSVESAARQNHDRPVELVIASKSLNTTTPTLKLLKELPNVKITQLDLDDFFHDTPMEEWYKEGKWKTSPYSVTHMANYVRVLSAKKYGGLYLDTDFVVTRSLNGLRNFVAIERSRDTDLNNAAFHFENGHPVLQKLIDYHAHHYIPDSWAGNGHDVFNKVIKGNCQINGSRAEGPNCGPGVNLLGPETFYPVRYMQWSTLFENRTSDELPKILTEAYAVHLWNKLSSRKPVFVGSSQYYALLAARYCPISYATALHTF